MGRTYSNTVIRILVNPKFQEESTQKCFKLYILRFAHILVCKMKNWCSLSGTQDQKFYFMHIIEAPILSEFCR